MVEKNRQQRRKELGINKRGLHNPKKKGSLLIVTPRMKFKHYIQRIGNRVINHAQAV